MDNLINLLSYGQSYWLDNLTRKKITSGELNKRVAEQGLRGITSNPSIFDKAIAGSSDYDEQIKILAGEGKTPQQIYDALTIKDVQDACNILKPVFNESGGTDGFVSLEVSPYLARDTQGTIKEARRLHTAVGRLNCMIKIPGTREGIPAIEQMLFEGISINITLLFSTARYYEVAQAYLRALERRIAAGKPVSQIISVASVFLSRIDTLTDQLIGHHIIPISENKNISRPELMLGKAGIVTAKLSYQYFKEIFSSDAWEKLKDKGANVQKLLWASTGNKDPLYKDLRYVESLIARDTVTTLPEDTIKAFAAHGNLKADTVEEGLADAKQLFPELKKHGIDIDFVTAQLENEGIQKFTDSYNTLISNLANKRMKVSGDQTSSQQISCGKLDKEINSAYASMDEKQTGRLLFAEDPYLWKTDTQEVKEISHRLGWLTLPDHFTKNADDLIAFAAKVKEEGYTHAVLLGMGGSSLCSEVARETFGSSGGYLQLLVLDNTDPAAILEVENKINIEKTLFIVASKSGDTKETLSFFQYFYHQLELKNTTGPGNNFVAITDAGTPLVKTAEQYKFRQVFINPPDLGGRYSVLSDFGLVPMALMGIDIKAFLSSAKQMEDCCDGIPAAANPGLSLGGVLGICQKHGRDKVTFVLSSSLSSFGFWVEQLLAESTGKEGRGLIPVNGETLATPGVYGKDRIFIHMYLPTDNNETDEIKLKMLEDAGHPIVRIRVANKLALGGEYYSWEIAVAVAGIMIGINAFNQPNVEESKKNTEQLLKGWSEEGSFEMPEPLFQSENTTIYVGKKAAQHATDHQGSAGEFVKSFLTQAKPNDYIALSPYFLMTDYRTKILQTWREQMRDELKEATTLLNGPRYLHSTGQLHKGGPDTGLYIILIGDEENELAIPGEKFGFRTLHLAQALGDFRSLNDKGRKVILIHLGTDIDSELNKLHLSIRAANKHPIQQEMYES
ncbi:MAG TPA: bifunctional transaldolase/phosoglucose isomerase [Bacteroidia bacterium]|nr:bifunctional transaldolase/phosoglucose isomerase [Bacteroidia bacterium]